MDLLEMSETWLMARGAALLIGVGVLAAAAITWLAYDWLRRRRRDPLRKGAHGEQLDVWGKILDCPRGKWETDRSYRIRLAEAARGSRMQRNAAGSNGGSFGPARSRGQRHNRPTPRHSRMPRAR